MKKIQGDLLDLAKHGYFDAIVHGCNCFHNMGGGIAAQIANQFPLAQAIDITHTKYGDASKLGSFTTALIISENHSPFIIINAYTQFQGGADVNYQAIMTVMENINKCFKGKKIGYPMIGAGIAGGNWELIEQTIDQILVDVDHTLVEYLPK